MSRSTTGPGAVAPTKPKTLRGPVRRRVKRAGKRLSRALSGFLARQGTVPDAPFLDPALFPFLAEFEARWAEIRDEARAVLRFRDAIPGFQDVSPDQYRIAVGTNWRTFVLYGFGERLERNCRHAPVTTEMLARVPNLGVAWFSTLAPGYHIPAHSGVIKGMLRAHLGLIVPAEAERCRIRVGDQVRAWREGRILVLDDTYEHEVWNDTGEERVVLLFDFERPMRPPGRIVQRLFTALMKRTAFYRTPKRNLKSYERRYEAAVRIAEAARDGSGDTAGRGG